VGLFTPNVVKECTAPAFTGQKVCKVCQTQKKRGEYVCPPLSWLVETGKINKPTVERQCLA